MSLLRKKEILCDRTKYSAKELMKQKRTAERIYLSVSWHCQKVLMYYAGC